MAILYNEKPLKYGQNEFNTVETRTIFGKSSRLPLDSFGKSAASIHRVPVIRYSTRSPSSITKTSERISFPPGRQPVLFTSSRAGR